jgi:hypothetical protein
MRNDPRQHSIEQRRGTVRVIQSSEIAPLYDPSVQHAFLNEEQIDVGDSAWQRLTCGQALGKRIVFAYDPDDDGVQDFPIEFFQLGGEDRDSTQMRIVLTPPTIIPIPAADLAGKNLQNLTNEYFNGTIGDADFPGSGAPVIWPPLSAIVEWGTNARTHAIVDIGNGRPINIAASWLRVRGGVTTDGFNVPGTAGAYVMSAFASPGWADNDTATRTVFMGTLTGNAESDIFAVPTFARKATVVGMTANVVTAANLNFWRSPNGTHPCGTFFQSGNAPGGFRVPNAAQYFSVNPEATGPYAVVFDLSL